MNSRERVLAAIEGESVDKVPFDLGSTRVSGITKPAFATLIEILNQRGHSFDLHKYSNSFFDAKQQLIEFDTEVCHALGVDVRGIMPNLARKNPEPVQKKGNLFFTDEWGITYKKPENSDQYYSRETGPLSEDPSVEDLDSLQWPDPADDKLFLGLESKASNYMQDGYAVVMEGLGAGIYETASRIRGPEKFYQDLVKRKDFSRALLNKVFSVKKDFWREAGERLGEHVQIIREGDDLAGQKNMLISPEIYRGMIKPLHNKLFEEIKNVFPGPAYVFFHSDGAMGEIVPDLVESGIDILNPIQVSAQGISLERIGDEFGNRLALWGAGIDTQTELPFESPEVIQSIVKDRLDEGSNYIFVFSAIHNIQKDVSKENLVSFLDSFWNNRER
ncbi:MAG: uroporphyrinogen decarboxylase family protein [Candidatus Bipolaricaulota bacterium]|nr:hypothetical protein [Candidatus Bipolaricaulota bacterium]